MADRDVSNDDACRVIPLPRRPPCLDEPPERPPAVVLAFPQAARREGESPGRGGTPPRLAV